MIRAARSDDRDAIERIYPKAFPDEDLLPLVGELIALGDAVVSLVAEFDSKIVGHVVFTPCRVEGFDVRVDLLGPLCVDPDHHRAGMGTALVQTGFEVISKVGSVASFVLGDPGYYSRFGYTTERSVVTPYPLPPDWYGAWQSLVLDNDAPALSGKLVVPPVWDHHHWWSDWRCRSAIVFDARLFFATPEERSRSSAG
ncbi:MAG: N-acetyltransferase [Pseudomonadota bacterium]